MSVECGLTCCSSLSRRVHGCPGAAPWPRLQRPPAPLPPLPVAAVALGLRARRGRGASKLGAETEERQEKMGVFQRRRKWMKKTDSEGETETEAAVCAVVLLTVVCNCKERSNGCQLLFLLFLRPALCSTSLLPSLRRCCHSTQLAAAAQLRDLSPLSASVTTLPLDWMDRLSVLSSTAHGAVKHAMVSHNPDRRAQVGPTQRGDHLTETREISQP